MMRKIKSFLSIDRYRALPQRERWMVVGVIAGIVLILFSFIWLPLHDELVRLRAVVPKQKGQIAQMQIQAREINQWRASGRVALTGGSLLVNLEQSATANGIRGRITRMEPEGSHGARVTLEGVHFNALISWLAMLQNQAGVHIEKASFDAQSSAGIVSARLVLRRPGG